MLVGREAERQAIEALVAGARVGESGSLLLIGEAGIGKSALLEDTAATAAAAGMRLLRATGAESESEVPFGALLQVLRPGLDLLDRIPQPQAEALASALALRPGTGGDRFAIGAATLSLLSRLAEEQPVAVLVDDAHLLDRPSAQALCFAARRLTADPVVLLLAARDDVPCAVIEAGLPTRLVVGLSESDSGTLVTTSGRRLAPDVVARLCAATGGNPLALIELADEADSLESLAPDVPVRVPASLARAFARRADRLSPAARTALLVAAAGAGDLVVVSRACTALGVSVEDLDEAEQVELVRLDLGTVRFRHDLVRSGVYTDATPAQRRAVHRALADALPEADADRRAWHLGEATLGPDESTAALLDAAAQRARDRSGPAVAASAYERAARLSPDPDRQVERLVSAAECAWLAGLTATAVDLLARAGPLDRVGLRIRAAALSGAVAARTGSLQDARDVHLRAGLEFADADPDAAISLLADAIVDCLFLADTATVVRAAAAIDELDARATSTRARWLGQMAAGVAGVLTGHGGPERIRRAVQRAVADDVLRHDTVLAPWLVIGPLFLRESGISRELVSAVMASLRRASAIGDLPFLLFAVGRDQATTDRWQDAEATYSEGIHLAREAGHTTDLVACLAGLTWLESRRGDETRCREHAQEALLIARERHLGLFEAWSLFALGDLELGFGRPDVALQHFQQLQQLLVGLGFEDVDLSPAPELVDALVRLGRPDDARELAAGYAQGAVAKGQPWSLARAARALAMTCPDDEVDQQITEALRHHEHTLDSFEVARTQLAHGARLRRARRRTDAREPLRAALATFDRLGAAPWAEQAAAELLATGESAQRRDASGIRELTPQELQVARLLAGGRTTREAAAALFLSPKTIEYHLRNVYIKLGITSRAELSAKLPSSPP
ncbi:helix-turn-helix transcriptional regulator [Angustibacter luteus]|uniref:Helix-turn-helix transcriptional regulator n=1 Tax=Angustibacter luteus TaxID=658456 RepID=A0ABW1JI64_9ACTN